MTRGTKAERLAREEAENVLRLEALKAEYPNKLISTLARAIRAHDYTVVPFTTEFTIRNEEEIFRVAYLFSEESNNILDDLIWVLDRLEERREYQYYRTASEQECSNRGTNETDVSRDPYATK